MAGRGGGGGSGGGAAPQSRSSAACAHRLFGISINVASLLQETNLGSERWRRGAATLPTAARLATPVPTTAEGGESAAADGGEGAVGVMGVVVHKVRAT